MILRTRTWGCRLGSNVGFLWTRWWMFRFHERSWISWPTERLSVSQEELCSMDFDRLTAL